MIDATVGSAGRITQEWDIQCSCFLYFLLCIHNPLFNYKFRLIDILLSRFKIAALMLSVVNVMIMTMMMIV